MTQAARRCWLVVILVALAAIGVAGGVLAHRRSRPAPGRDLYQRGVMALEKGETSTVRSIEAQLRQKGKLADSRLLAGRLALRNVQRARSRSLRLRRTGLPQLVGQMVLAAPGLGQVPASVQPAAWLMSALLQEPAPLAEAGQAELRQALAEFTQVRDEGEAGAEATRLAADCLRRLDARAVAAAGLQALLERDPDDLAARQLLAAIYVDAIDVPDALPQLRAWAQWTPADGRPQRWIGWLLKDDGNPKEAIAAYRQALQADLPPAMRVDAAVELAGVLAERQSQFAEALRALEPTPAAAHSRSDVRLIQARCLIGLRRPNEAIPILDSLLQTDPSNLEALKWRAQIELDAGRPQLALPLLRQAAATCPRDERSQDLLTSTYDSLGQKAEAQQHRQQAAEGRRLREQLDHLRAQARSRPWDGLIRFQVGACCVQLHRWSEAGTWLHATLACNPTDDLARQLLAQLDMDPQVPLRIKLDDSSAGR